MFLFRWWGQCDWRRKNKTSVSNRILKTCNVEVFCIVLSVLLARLTANFKKKNKSCWGNNKNWLFLKSKCKGVVNKAKEGEWSCHVNLSPSLSYWIFYPLIIIFKCTYGNNERPWPVMKKKGGRMKNKNDEYSQWVWLSEATTVKGWKGLVFHFCDGGN